MRGKLGNPRSTLADSAISDARDAEHHVRRGARIGLPRVGHGRRRGVVAELELAAALRAGAEDPQALDHRGGVPGELAAGAAHGEVLAHQGRHRRPAAAALLDRSSNDARRGAGRRRQRSMSRGLRRYGARSMRRRPLAVLIATAAAAAIGAPSASALTTHSCPRTTDFRCGTVTVPLDRTGTVPGTVKLAVAVEKPRKGASGFLLALSGGPGQPAVAYADSFRSSLAPALEHRRLILIDQRGTGRSGALRCPSLQALGTLDVVNTLIVEACAKALGPARQFYSTTESARDIEAVRAAIGAPKLELMG